MSDCEKNKSGVDLPSNYNTLTCQRAKNNKLSARALKNEAWKVEVRRRLGVERHDGPGPGEEKLQTHQLLYPRLLRLD